MIIIGLLKEEDDEALSPRNMSNGSTGSRYDIKEQTIQHEGCCNGQNPRCI